MRQSGAHPKKPDAEEPYGQISGSNKEQADERHKSKHSPFEDKEIDAVFEELMSGKDGLSTEEAKRRLDENGPNELEEHKTHPVLKFLGYFWGPIPWMIEVAAVLSAIIRHFADLAIILLLLLINAGVGFWEEHQAENAVDALRKTLAQKAKVRRDGDWREVDGRELVRGDVLKLEMGTVVPADVKLIKGDVSTSRHSPANHYRNAATSLSRARMSRRVPWKAWSLRLVWIPCLARPLSSSARRVPYPSSRRRSAALRAT